MIDGEIGRVAFQPSPEHTMTERTESPQRRIVVGITGASGAAYAVRVVELLAAAEVEVHLACSDLGKRLLIEELGIKKLEIGRAHV